MTLGHTQENISKRGPQRRIALIKALGFEHVRLSVNPQPMFRGNQADRIPAEYLGYLEQAVQ